MLNYLQIPSGLQNGDNNSVVPTAKTTILFNTSKKELFEPSSGYKTLQSRLKVNWSVGLQRDELTPERLNSARLVVFGGPRDKFSAMEVATYCMAIVSVMGIIFKCS